jgi:hypothetical protein
MRAIITFHSTVHALNAEQSLLDAGVSVGLMSRPNELGADCGFCVRVEEIDLERALEIFRAAGLVWQGAYIDTSVEVPRFRPIELKGDEERK